MSNNCDIKVSKSFMRLMSSHGSFSLANGEVEIPQGWMNATIHLHDLALTLLAAILSSQAITYNMVLGWDFIFFSWMQLNVTDQKYSFKPAPIKEYTFKPENASVSIVSSQKVRHKTFPC